MSLTRQEIRSRSRQYDKALDKMQKIEATTLRLMELGVIKKKGPIKRMFEKIKGLF